MTRNRPLESLSPGQVIQRELDARNWSQVDLAEILGRSVQLVNELIAGKRGITPETAKGLSQAFGTTAELWMNLDAADQLARSGDADPDVALRARIYAKGPIKEMVKRGWLPHASDAKALEEGLIQFFNLKSLEDEPSFWNHAARKSTSYLETTRSQVSWLFQARRLARRIETIGKFNRAALIQALAELEELLHSADDVASVPEILSRAGIRFLIVEALPQTRIDGACFWLDDDSPCVVLSLRYDRIDYFWHTLMHELGHVYAEDARGNDREPLDLDLVGQQAATSELKPPFEQQADEFAVSRLVPQDELDDFVARNRPLYSRLKIVGFARRFNLHPGIVVGQLQHRHEILYSHSRDLLVKVRNMITDVALTDGWGKTQTA